MVAAGVFVRGPFHFVWRFNALEAVSAFSVSGSLPDCCRLGYSCRCSSWEHQGRENQVPLEYVVGLDLLPRQKKRWAGSKRQSVPPNVDSNTVRRDSVRVAWRLKKAGYTSLADRYHRCRVTNYRCVLVRGLQTDRPGCCGSMGPFFYSN